MSLLTSFARSERGAVAIIFAASLVTIAIAVGAAIDFGRAHSLRQEMQSTLDAGVLAAAKAVVLKGGDVDTTLKTFVAASELKKENIVIDIVSGTSGANGEVSGAMSGRMPTTLMRLIGQSEMEIAVESSVALGTGNMDLVLVLDSTGSMAGSRLETLKTAAKDLVTTLHDLPNAEEIIKIGVVPFARYVNVGLANRNASWIDVPLEYSEQVCSMQKPVISKSGCTTQTGNGTNDGVPYTYTYETCSSYEYGPEQNVCYNKQHVWNGCVGSRNYPLNVTDGNYGTRIPGLLDTSCSAALTPLTNTKSTLMSSIDTLSASGDTYIPSGLAWGWRLLSKQEPFTEASEQNDKLKRYVVLMTDGANTRSPQYPDHNGSDTTKANDLTAELCNNIKAEGIEIFSIAFQVTDNTSKTMLQNCASAGGAFYDAINASKLKAAFTDIGHSMMEVRLTK